MSANSSRYFLLSALVLFSGCNLKGTHDTCLQQSDCRTGNICNLSTNHCEAPMDWDAGASDANPSGPTFLKASNTGAGDSFGTTIVTHGDTIAIGAFLEGSSATGVGMSSQGSDNNTVPLSGSVYVFRQGPNGWQQEAYLKASNTGVDDQFGITLSLYGDTLVVGAYLEDSPGDGINPPGQNTNTLPNSGAAYVFTRTGSTWSQQAFIKAATPEANAHFGVRVSLSSDTLAISTTKTDGAGGTIENSGAVYVYAREGSTWTQEAYLEASTVDTEDHFGLTTALDNNTLVVGAAYEASTAAGINGDQANNDAPRSGAAYVFVRTGTTWTQQAYLKASNSDAADFFSRSISISGDTVVIGAPFESSISSGVNGNESDNSANGAGAAYVFQRTGVTWGQQAYLKASNPDGNDAFGYHTAIRGDRIVIGAYGEDDGGQASGAAYVFARSGSTWSQAKVLRAPIPSEGDHFGQELAITDDRIIIGSPYQNSNSVGINSTQNSDCRNASCDHCFDNENCATCSLTEDCAYASGAAYVYVYE